MCGATRRMCVLQHFYFSIVSFLEYQSAWIADNHCRSMMFSHSALPRQYNVALGANSMYKIQSIHWEKRYHVSNHLIAQRHHRSAFARKLSHRSVQSQVHRVFENAFSMIRRSHSQFYLLSRGVSSLGCDFNRIGPDPTRSVVAWNIQTTVAVFPPQREKSSMIKKV
jgi:hypothetical protein